jgi:predicted nucleic acid-binding protein
MALNKSVISDSTTLISLLNIDRFEILFNFSSIIIIPHSVYQEVSCQFHAKKALDGYIADGQVKVKTVNSNNALDQLLIRLDLGESEAILLAKEENLPLIIDEKKGRKVAQELNLNTIGLIGILRIYKVKGLLSSSAINEIVNDLRQVDFRVSAQLLAFLLDG